MEPFLAAVGTFLHTGLVVLVAEFPDRLVEFDGRRERAVTQLGINAVITYFDLVLHEGFLCG